MQANQSATGASTYVEGNSNFRASDLQVAKLGTNFAMAHKMGLVRLNPTTKSVATTLTYTYNKSDGGYTSSTSGTSTITASNDFTGNKPYAVNSQYWHIVKATGVNTNTAMSFTCNPNQKDFWSEKSSGTNVGYGKYRLIDIQSDRTAANFVAQFSCVKKCQTITLPWYDSYIMECWGAQGGDVPSIGAGSGPVPYGGKGAYVKGTIILSRDNVLYVYVGEQGGYDITSNVRTFNGGGCGNSTTSDGHAARGGGATDIRTSKHSESDGWGGNTSLNSRIIIAAGGGGCTSYGTVATSTGNGSGGAAGGLIGYSGSTTYKPSKASAVASGSATNASGGNQQNGGIGMLWDGAPTVNGSLSSSNGSKGYGGMVEDIMYTAGGGSGLYGGGSGGVVPACVGSAAGGSSFISGHPGCITISGYAFASGSTKMIDGKGLLWTTSSQTTGGSAERMPTTSGGQEALNTGHSGDGYAKITSQ